MYTNLVFSFYFVFSSFIRSSGIFVLSAVSFHSSSFFFLFCFFVSLHFAVCFTTANLSRRHKVCEKCEKTFRHSTLVVTVTKDSHACENVCASAMFGTFVLFLLQFFFPIHSRILWAFVCSLTHVKIIVDSHSKNALFHVCLRVFFSISAFRSSYYCLNVRERERKARNSRAKNRRRVFTLEKQERKIVISVCRISNQPNQRMS